MHHRRSLNSQVTQRANHLPHSHRSRSQQQNFTRRMRSQCSTWCLLVEVVELLRQLEGILRQEGRLRGSKRLLDQRRQPRSQQPGLPHAAPILPRRPERSSSETAASEASSVVSCLAKDVSRPDDRILHVRPRLPSKLSASLKSKAITVFRVNRSMKYRSAPTPTCVAMATRSNFAQLRMPSIHLHLRRRNQLVQQVVRLHAKNPPPAHLQVSRLLLSSSLTG